MKILESLVFGMLVLISSFAVSYQVMLLRRLELHLCTVTATATLGV